jgi:hypothetical protein
MLTMTEEEARAIMKTYGWNYKERKRRGQGKKYIYAQRRQGLEMKERYICPLSRLSDFTERKLVEILAPPPEPIEEPSSADHEPEAPNTSSTTTNEDEP